MPEVDFTRLNVREQEEIKNYQAQIKRMQKENRDLEKKAKKIKQDKIKTRGDELERLRQQKELEAFYEKCIRSCTKEIVKIHERNQIFSL